MMPAVVQSKSNRYRAATARTPAVAIVPRTPSEAIGSAARLNLRQPTCMPPSKRITISATTAIRSTVLMSEKTTGKTAAARRNRAGAGIGNRLLSFRTRRASITPPATISTIRPKSPSSATERR